MKTKRLLMYALFVLLPALFTACEKEPVTFMSTIEKELKEKIEERGITKCSVFVTYGGSNDCKYQDVEFTIEGGCVIVDAYHYNLIFLSKYLLGNNYITFFFSNTKF